MEQLQHASIVARYEGRDSTQIEIFDVQFNPSEFTLDKGLQHAEIAIPGLDSPRALLTTDLIRDELPDLSVLTSDPAWIATILSSP